MLLAHPPSRGIVRPPIGLWPSRARAPGASSPLLIVALTPSAWRGRYRDHQGGASGRLGIDLPSRPSARHMDAPRRKPQAAPGRAVRSSSPHESWDIGITDLLEMSKINDLPEK